MVVRGSVNEVAGSGGTDGSAGAPRLRDDVRSPVTDRLHAERFGTSTPKRVSMNRRSEV